MKKLLSVLLALVFAFSFVLAQDAMKPQDTGKAPEKKEMKMSKKSSKKKTTKMAKKATKKSMKKSSMKGKKAMKKDDMGKKDEGAK